jgi:3-oxoacyl-[acyl-carrier protein] reductase
MDFTGKNIIVTGGASGIGRAVTEGIIERKGRVAVLDKCIGHAAELQVTFGQDAVKFYTTDLKDTNATRDVVKRIIYDYRRIHGLVNCAGVVSTRHFEELEEEEWNRVIAINLTGVFTCISAVYKHMCSYGGGRIVNVSSVAAKLGGGLVGTSAYASSKAGVIGLTKAVAREGAAHGVFCNAVCPSFTETAMVSGVPENTKERIIAQIPLKRAAQPKEIANVVLFYLSDMASFVTGEIADVDGGLTMD